MLEISPKNLDVVLKYLGGLNSHLIKQVVFFKLRTIDDVFVQEKYLDVDNMKGQ